MSEQKLRRAAGGNPIDFVNRFLAFGEGNFDETAVTLHEWQRERCAPYRAYCEGFAAPQRWEDVPAIPLSAFRDAQIRCFQAGETVRTFQTSGTTGSGVGRHFFRTLDFYRTSALGGWRHAGLPDFPVLALLPLPVDAPHSSLSCMAGWLAGEGDFYFGRWEGLKRRLGAPGGPVVLFGTALAFLDFFDFLGNGRLDLPAGTVAVETGGYKGTRREMSKADLYALFEARLGLGLDSVWNEYGMTELSSQFYTRGLGGVHRGPPWVRACVVDPETGTEARDGETGVLKIVDLANVDSCCAILTRDVAVRRGGNFELIGRDPAALPRGCSRGAEEMLP